MSVISLIIAMLFKCWFGVFIAEADRKVWYWHREKIWSCGTVSGWEGRVLLILPWVQMLSNEGRGVVDCCTNSFAVWTCTSEIRYGWPLTIIETNEGKMNECWMTMQWKHSKALLGWNKTNWYQIDSSWLNQGLLDIDKLARPIGSSILRCIVIRGVFSVVMQLRNITTL